MCMEHGNVLQNYLTDNGVIKADDFVWNINAHQ